MRQQINDLTVRPGSLSSPYPLDRSVGNGGLWLDVARGSATVTRRRGTMDARETVTSPNGMGIRRRPMTRVLHTASTIDGVNSRSSSLSLRRCASSSAFWDKNRRGNRVGMTANFDPNQTHIEVGNQARYPRGRLQAASARWDHSSPLIPAQVSCRFRYQKRLIKLVWRSSSWYGRGTPQAHED